MPMLQPGEQTTQIVLWELDDPTKHGDPSFWWPSEHRFELPQGRELSGPKGSSLADLRKQFGGDDVELAVPPPGIAAARRSGATAEEPRKLKVSTAGWGGSEPDRTYVIISHHYRPTAEEAAEEKARRGGASPFPPAAEAMRQRWLAALEAGDRAEAAELKAEFDEQLGQQGWRKPYAQPCAGVEIQPGVYLLDARPQPVA
jgi:hypothetical protein